jgi:photosystem II stability/assembly factor-like uncharacterized protein
VFLPGSIWTVTPDAAVGQQQPRFKGIFEPVSDAEPINLTSVWFADETEGWAAGAAGTVIHTSDGGDAWTAQLGGDPQSKEAELTDLFFLDRTHGWVVGGNVNTVQKRLLGTSDGRTWRQTGVVGTQTGSYRDYAFVSPTRGVFVNDDGQIHMTEDGGRTWTQTGECKARVRVSGVFSDASCALKTLHFVNERVGFAAGGGTAGVLIVMKTEDGGSTWQVAFAEPNRGGDNAAHLPMDIAFTDEVHGLIRLATKEVLITADGGKTWESSVSSLAEGRLIFADAQVGWSIAGYSRVEFSYTTNGGNSWSKRTIGFPAQFAAFALPARQRGYVVGRSGMIFRYRVVPADFRAPDIIDAPVMPAAPAGRGRAFASAR